MGKFQDLTTSGNIISFILDGKLYCLYTSERIHLEQFLPCSPLEDEVMHPRPFKPEHDPPPQNCRQSSLSSSEGQSVSEVQKMEGENKSEVREERDSIR